MCEQYMYTNRHLLNTDYFAHEILLVDIDIEIFGRFNKLHSLTTDMSLVAKALSTSELLQVQISC